MGERRWRGTFGFLYCQLVTILFNMCRRRLGPWVVLFGCWPFYISFSLMAALGPSYSQSVGELLVFLVIDLLSFAWRVILAGNVGNGFHFLRVTRNVFRSLNPPPPFMDNSNEIKMGREIRSGWDVRFGQIEHHNHNVLFASGTEKAHSLV